MLQRDYLSKIIESFTKSCEQSLRLALVTRSDDAITETEDALGELMELDPQTLLRLAPESFVTMMRLGGNGEATGDYVAYVLNALADAYLLQGDRETAVLRRGQARAVSLAFGVVGGDVPPQFEDLDGVLQQVDRKSVV